MRVAINLEQLLYRAPGGIGRYSARLMTLLPRLYPADTFKAFCARHADGDVREAFRRFDLEGVVPSVLPLPRPVLYDMWHAFDQPKLTRLSPELTSLDLVHAPSVGVPPSGPYRLVVTVHDAAPVLFPEAFTLRGRWFHRMGLRATRRRADLIITVSESAKREICDNTDLDADRIRVVHNGVAPASVPDEIIERVRRRELLDDRPFVLWVGTLEPRKNVLTLLLAFRRLVRRDLPHRLVLVGPQGWGDTGAAIAADVEALGDNLRLLGAVDETTLHALYTGADAFAFPSIHEGFGLPVLEAMIQGTPVICSDASSLPEVTGDAAVLVPPTDVDAWADGLYQILTDRDLRDHLARLGPARAREFTWEKTIRATHAVYEEAGGM